VRRVLDGGPRFIPPGGATYCTPVVGRAYVQVVTNIYIHTAADRLRCCLDCYERL